jgi:hypothetical protein
MLTAGYSWDFLIKTERIDLQLTERFAHGTSPKQNQQTIKDKIVTNLGLKQQFVMLYFMHDTK